MIPRVCLALIFFLTSCSSMAQKECICYDESIAGNVLYMPVSEKITDTFEIVSIIPLDKRCCKFVGKRILQQTQKNNKKYVKTMNKNNKCWVVADKRIQKKRRAYLIHVRKGQNIYVIISQSMQNKYNSEEIMINKSYLLTLILQTNYNTFPKHGIMRSIHLNNIQYILDTGYMWFTNLYTTEDISGINYIRNNPDSKLYYTPQR